jgi:hypothetical protein
MQAGAPHNGCDMYVISSTIGALDGLCQHACPKRTLCMPLWERWHVSAAAHGRLTIPFRACVPLAVGVTVGPTFEAIAKCLSILSFGLSVVNL